MQNAMRNKFTKQQELFLHEKKTQTRPLVSMRGRFFTTEPHRKPILQATETYRSKSPAYKTRKHLKSPLLQVN